jgi:hypothetical protein
VQLTDWPADTRRPRSILIHMAYLRAGRRAGVRTGWIFTPDEIASRDKWTCAICGHAVLHRWTADQLGCAPVYTFRVPWAEGGRYDQANARLAHYGCATPADRHLRRALERALAGDLAVKAKASRNDTHCTSGHPLSGANLLKASDGRRRCRQCRRDRERAQPGAA